MPINNGWNLEGNYNLKDILYNVAFFPLPIIWFMLFIIIFNLKDKIYFAGIDLIDGYLIGDINVTSPTGLPQFKDLTGKNLAKDFWDGLGLK